jgi:hypothetical protein
VVEWCTHHKDDPPAPECDESCDSKRSDDIDPWDFDFMKVTENSSSHLASSRLMFSCKATESKTQCCTAVCPWTVRIDTYFYCFSLFSLSLSLSLSLAQVKQSTLFELTLAANYLDIKGLLDLVCKTVANMIKGKTPKQIRQTFNIKNDFTPEEEEQVRKENVWCEETK